MGLTVLPAADGQEALRLAAEENPEVFVVDIGLPGMSGYDLARILRELPGTQQRLLIALTGYGTAEDKKRAAEAGLDYHLTETADVDQVYRLVAKKEPPALPRAYNNVLPRERGSTGPPLDEPPWPRAGPLPALKNPPLH